MAIRLAVAARLLPTERLALIDRLQPAITSRDDESALSAITLVRRLGLVVPMEAVLCQVARAGRARVASAATLALGAGQTDASMEVLDEALTHADPRTQANAVEAIGRRLGPDDAPRLAAFVEVKPNRTRANAVRARLDWCEAAANAELVRMLQDPRPEHRRSGIWVARRTRASATAECLHQLSLDDAEPDIRTRAEAAIRFLTARTPRTAHEEIRP